MMPMRIRCKGQPIEKLENPTALQCGGRSFPCGHATQFTLASTRGRIAPCIGEQAEQSTLKRDCLGIVMAGSSPGMTTA